MIHSSGKSLKAELDIDHQQIILDLNNRYLPYSQAPVAVSNNGKIELKLMNFGLVPSWSHTPKVKFATHNARIETVLEKPTWREPFLKRHCLIPMTHFIESITEIGKPLAGNMVRFKECSDSIMVAAGVYDQWVNKETGEIINSFAILTTEPPKYVQEVGHDRCPIFIKKGAYKDWINNNFSGQEALEYLKKNHREIDFKVEIDRPLKPGWEKRSG